MDALLKAIKVAGSQAELARLIGAAGQSTVGNWLRRGGTVPVEYCARVELATGISRQELRPDDYWVIWPELARKWAGARSRCSEPQERT